MFLRKLIIFILLAINFIIVSSVYSKTCDINTGDLKIYLSWDDESWLYSWQANKLQKKQASYSLSYATGRINIRKGISDKRSESLPQDLVLPDKRFDMPFDINHNGELLIATIYDNRISLPPSKNLALVNIKRKHIIRVLETDYYVRSLVWSPDGNYFAVLFAQDVTKQTLKRFSLGNLIGGFLGHPTSYHTFHISIYDTTGILLCTERIIESIPNGSGYIDWNK